MQRSAVLWPLTLFSDSAFTIVFVARWQHIKRRGACMLSVSIQDPAVRARNNQAVCSLPRLSSSGPLTQAAVTLSLPRWVLRGQRAAVVTLQPTAHQTFGQHDRQPATGMQQACAYAAAVSVLLDAPTSADSHATAHRHLAACSTSPQHCQHEAVLAAGEQT